MQGISTDNGDASVFDPIKMTDTTDLNRELIYPWFNNTLVVATKTASQDKDIILKVIEVILNVNLTLNTEKHIFVNQ